MDPGLKKFIHRFVSQHISLFQKACCAVIPRMLHAHSLHDAVIVCKVEAERRASGAPGSGSDAGADAGSRQVQALVRPGLARETDPGVSTAGVLPPVPRCSTVSMPRWPCRSG